MSDTWRAIRPGLLLAVLFSMTAAARTAAEPTPWPRLALALLGAAMAILGATAANQLFERRHDARMERTAARPLPSGRATAWQAAAFAAAASLGGIACLTATQPPAVPLLAAAGWLVYALLYTPLKRRSLWNLPFGAAAGAMPVVLGAASAGAMQEPLTFALFGIVFFWQFSHTAAIGWLFREQYARAGAKVAAAADPTGRLAGRLALWGAAGLLAASLAPVALSTCCGWTYALVAASLGVAHLVVAAKFLAAPGDANARSLKRIALVHLPALLAALMSAR